MFFVVIDEFLGCVIVVLLVVFFCILVVKDIVKFVWQFDVFFILFGILVVLIVVFVMFLNVLFDKDVNVVWCVLSIYFDDDELLLLQLLCVI